MVRVGWIGLGVMGTPMVRCVARAGHQVSAFDVDPERANAVADDGVTVAGSVTRAVEGSDVVAIMVATPDQVESVLFGEDGAASVIERGTVVLVMATVGPSSIQSWAGRLSAQGIELVDAPVSGGPGRAATADLLMMVGGSDAAISRVRPVIDVLASNVAVIGTDPGDGQKLKMVNQLLCGVHIAAAAEALAFAEAMGLDGRTSWETLRHGAAASFMLADRGERMVDGSFDHVRSALSIFVKDMGLVAEAARNNAYPTPLASTVEQLYRAGDRAGLSGLDDSSVIEICRGAAAGRQHKS